MPPRWFPNAAGGGAAASAPAFVMAATKVAADASITLSGLQAGDLIVLACCQNTGNSGPAAQWAFVVNTLDAGGSPPFLYLLYHRVSPADGSTFTYIGATPNFGSVAAIALRHVFGTPDGLGTVSVVTNTTTVTTNAFTTTLNQDVGIWAVGLQGSTNDISAAPAGYTLNTNAHTPVSGSAQGVAIAYNLNLGNAGSNTPGNATATLGSSSKAASYAFGMQGFRSSY